MNELDSNSAFSTKITNKIYKKELKKLHLELIKLQQWIKHEKLKVVVIFEGRDAAIAAKLIGTFINGIGGHCVLDICFMLIHENVLLFVPVSFVPLKLYKGLHSHSIRLLMFKNICFVDGVTNFSVSNSSRNA